MSVDSFHCCETPPPSSEGLLNYLLSEYLVCEQIFLFPCDLFFLFCFKEQSSKVVGDKSPRMNFISLFETIRDILSQLKTFL